MSDNNIQEFDVGQKVIIVGAGGEQDDFEHWVCFVRPQMSNLVGKVATISIKHNNERYKGRITYRLNEFNYCWADKWLVPLCKTSDFIYS